MLLKKSKGVVYPFSTNVNKCINGHTINLCKTKKVLIEKFKKLKSYVSFYNNNHTI